MRRFFIITTDSDFVRIAEYLNSDTPSYIIGVGTKQASETLRNAYDEFMVYPPEEKEKKTARKTKAVKDEAKQEKKTAKAAKETTATKTAKTVKQPKETKVAKAAKTEKAVKAAKTAKAAKAEDNAALSDGNLTVKLPRTLRETLQERQAAEGVSMDELVTYLLMRGMARWVED